MTTAQTASAEISAQQQAAERQPALPLRGDTLLGVCEAVGQDLGFNPTWLRIAFAMLLMWNPEVVVAAYLGLGVVVAITRWLLADRASKAATQQDEAGADFAEAEEELLAA